VAPLGGTIGSTTTDGITWKALDWSITSVGSVAYGNGKFVGLGRYVSTNTSFYSTDGVTWSTTTMPTVTTSDEWTQLIYGNGIFVALSYDSTNTPSGDYATSTNGINWTSRTLPIAGLWVTALGETDYF
jgi:hypothetical protein